MTSRITSITPLFLLTITLFLSTHSSSQQKYLVSPRDEVIPLRNGTSPGTIIAKRQALARLSSKSVGGQASFTAGGACGNRFIFGYPENIYTSNSIFGAFHKDVMAEWFIAKATGTIDTIYWEALGSVGALDSTLYMRFGSSRIGPTYGPGIPPYKPPCQNWGYFINTNDLDQGVAAFRDDATDTTWISTIDPASGPPTRPPFTPNSWWGSIPVIDHANSINFVAWSDVGVPLPVTMGQQFFIAYRVKGPNAHIVDDRTWFVASGFHVDNTDENYPSRDWKFYEHDSGPDNCGGIPRHLVKRGWVARGGFTSDTLDVALFNFWYSMTVTSNVPPSVDRADVYHNTFNQGPYLITSDITDCDPPDPPRAGVKSAKIVWSINNISQTQISMTYAGGDEWTGTIPGPQPTGSTITYKIIAMDSLNLTSSGPPVTFRIVTLASGYYYVDTAAVCTSHDIRLTGTVVGFDQFYVPPNVLDQPLPRDDGTFGPIDMGAKFPHFGETYRYAWVGIDGAIALSNNPTDTVDVNANGFFAPFDFPATAVRHGGRSDTSNQGAMPSNFIAPFWNDLWGGKSTTFVCRGHIGYGNEGDTCLFIVEWDSIGAYPGIIQPNCEDEPVFRVVLNRCDGTIEFQYDNMGYQGLDTSGLIGMQGTDPSQYIFINHGYPVASRPRNGHCFRFYPGATAVTRDGWNMISLGVIPKNGDYHFHALYPTAIKGFSYQGSYHEIYTSELLKNGVGYWMKFSGGSTVGPYGTLVMQVYDTARVGWNLIGTIGTPVKKTTIVQSTPGMITANYFGYGTSGYFTTSTLRPGYSYWARSNANGTLFLNGFAPSAKDKSVPETNLNALSKLTIMDGAGHQQVLYIGEAYLMKEQLESYEMPPAMMQFDARFATQRMVETYPTLMEKGAHLEYPLAISSGFAAKIVYEMKKIDDRQFVLTADGKTVATLNGAGVVTLDANVKNAALIVSEGAQIPKAFALSQNYPNPFNPTTRLNYDMPKTAIVDIAVYDVLGRKIATLYRGEQNEGRHTTEWNGTDAHGISVPTGVYFIRMKSNEFDATRKAMLMK